MGLLTMLKLDTTLLAMLKLDTILVAMLKLDRGGSPRRGASGKHLWAALLSAMLLEVDTVLDSQLLANLPDRWRVGRSMLGWSNISTTPRGSVDTRLPRSPSTGSRRPPTVVFTSTRLASTTWSSP